MTQRPGRTPWEAIRDGDALDRAIEAARRRVIKRHKQLGVPLVIWRDDAVVEVSAESIEAELAEQGEKPDVER